MAITRSALFHLLLPHLIFGSATIAGLHELYAREEASRPKSLPLMPEQVKTSPVVDELVDPIASIAILRTTPDASIPLVIKSAPDRSYTLFLIDPANHIRLVANVPANSAGRVLAPPGRWEVRASRYFQGSAPIALVEAGRPGIHVANTTLAVSHRQLDTALIDLSRLKETAPHDL
jgi:hypothetical protein